VCGRFVNHIQALRGWLDILGDWPADIPTGYNVAPTQTVPAVQAQGTFPMRWGLVPAWSKEVSPKYATFNARLESASTKPAFRNAWTHSQTCLLPALGYYEWCTEQGAKRPYFVHAAKKQGLLVFVRNHCLTSPEYALDTLTIEGGGSARQRGTEMIEFAQSTGNVYADLGHVDADEMLVKAQLTTKIGEIIKGRKWTQQKAADVLGLPQPKLSKMLRGQFRGISEAKMLDCLARLGWDVQIVVGPARRSSSAGHVVVVFAP